MAEKARVEVSNIEAVLSLCSMLRSSFGPRAFNKLIVKKDTVITNDGSTLMKSIVNDQSHPVLQLVRSVSESQDKLCGDGTTSVVLLVGAILKQMKSLVECEMSTVKIADEINKVKPVISKAIEEVVIPINVNIQENKDEDENQLESGASQSGASPRGGDVDAGLLKSIGKASRESMMKAARTTLESKIVSSVFDMSGLAVDAVLLSNGEMERVKIMKDPSGTLEDSTLVRGLVVKSKDELSLKGSCRVSVIQYCISPPKPYIDSNVVLNDPSMMDSVIKEERDYTLKLCKEIKSLGTELLLIQKCIVREECSDLAKQYLNRMGVAVIDNIERDVIEDLIRMAKESPEDRTKRSASDDGNVIYTFNCEVNTVKKFVSIVNPNYSSVIIFGAMADEAERCLNDALWVAKSLLDAPYLVPGGGVVECNIARRLREYAFLPRDGNEGDQSRPMPSVVMGLARAFEDIPAILSNNAGLDTPLIMSRMRESRKGINIKMECTGDMVTEEVVAPMKVVESFVRQALECAQMILRIDDVLPSND